MVFVFVVFVGISIVGVRLIWGSVWVLRLLGGLNIFLLLLGELGKVVYKGLRNIYILIIIIIIICKEG